MLDLIPLSPTQHRGRAHDRVTFPGNSIRTRLLPVILMDPEGRRHNNDQTVTFPHVAGFSRHRRDV